MSSQIEQLRPLHEWTFDYLKYLPHDELDWCDYKKSAWLNDGGWMDDASAYLSAYSNYDGGYLIVGMERSNDGYCFDGGVPSKHSQKGEWNEWLEDKLPSLVEPTLPAISVRFVASSQDPKHGVLVIHVPPSDRAPHQAKDCKYYQRVGSKNTPLRHKTVNDIAGRKHHPSVALEASIVKRPESGDEPSLLNLEISNTSNILCERFGMQVDFPLEIDSKVVGFDNSLGAYIESDESHDFYRIWLHSGLHPLFPQDSRMRRVEFRLRRGHFVVEERRAKVSNFLRVRVFADSAPFVDFRFPIANILRNDRIQIS